MNWLCSGANSPSSRTYCELEEVEDETHFSVLFYTVLTMMTYKCQYKTVFLKFQDVFVESRMERLFNSNAYKKAGSVSKA